MSTASQALSALALHVDAVAGVNATTQTLTGISTEDTLIHVLHFTPSAGVVDVTSHTTISAADEITVDADYSDDFLVAVWQDGNCAASARQVASDMSLRFTLLNGSDTTATVAGIATNDVIIAALHGTTASNIDAFASLTDVTISAANTVTFGTGTANDRILLIWQDVDAVTPVQRSAACLRIEVLDGHNTTKAVTGMVAGDEIAFAGLFTLSTADVTTLTDVTSICTAAAGAVNFSTTATNGHKVWLWWYDTSA